MLLLAVIALGLSSRVQAEFGDPIRGQGLFQEKECVQCHAVRGAGGRVGPDLGRKAVKDSFYEITAGMWNHSVAMSEKMTEFTLSRPSFEGTELADLVSFLYFLNYFDEAGDPRLGRTLFREKNCIQCHRVAEEGGERGPALDDLPRGISPLRVAESIWNHGPAMVSAMEAAGLEVPVFKDQEIIDLIAYLRSNGQRQRRRRFQSPGDPGRGEVLFRTKGCRRCHEVFGEDARLGPDLGRAELRGSVTQIAARMWNHWTVMANAMLALDMPVPQFDEGDLADLFSYIFVLRYDGLEGDATVGEQVYLDKRCSTCHGRQAEGDVGPVLAQSTLLDQEEDFTQRMWNHAPQMREMMEQHKISWPRFEGSDLADLIAYLASDKAANGR